MHKHVIKRCAATVAVGVVAVAGTGGSAAASEYLHNTVVSTDAADYVPQLVAVSGQPAPVAFSIAEADDQMVVGGKFTQVSGGGATYNRSNVVAFNASTGAVSSSFAPAVDGEVWSVLSDGTSVYIGGTFRNVNGTARAALAKLSLSTGALDTSFVPPFSTGRVTDMKMSGGKLFVSGVFGKRLMALDPSTGRPATYLNPVTNKRSPYVVPVASGQLPGSTMPQVFKFDISPDGKHLVAVGNFTAVDGVDRPRVFMLDLGAASATLSDWNYEPLALSCTSKRSNAIAYVQDVDFAPDSSYFALAAFGYMYQSGQRGLQLCDSVSRFETNALDPSKPTWINYTGGDSLKSVAVTDAAVYVQGHSRWLDNPFGQDSKGAGAVDRLGGGAVDPVTGMALDWNPVMPQQSGGFQILPTSKGVWFATDGVRFGNETHRGIRFAPLP